ATLTVEGKFDYLARQLGLGGTGVTRHHTAEKTVETATHQEGNLGDLDARCEYLQVGTPFDYRKNCMLGVPRDLPPPNDSRYDDAIAPAIIEMLRITGGRAFVLFTSYRSLQSVLGRVQRQLDDI